MNPPAPRVTWARSTKNAHKARATKGINNARAALEEVDKMISKLETKRGKLQKQLHTRLEKFELKHGNAGGGESDDDSWSTISEKTDHSEIFEIPFETPVHVNTIREAINLSNRR